MNQVSEIHERAHRSTLVLCGADTAWDFPNGKASSTPCTGLTYKEPQLVQQDTRLLDPKCAVWAPSPTAYLWRGVSSRKTSSVPKAKQNGLGLGWEKPEVLGEASSEQTQPAVPVLGQGPLATQNGYCCHCYTSIHWHESSHWEKQVLEEDTKMTCPWKNGI